MNIILYGIIVMSLSLLTCILPAVFGIPVMAALAISISSILAMFIFYSCLEAKTNE